MTLISIVSTSAYYLSILAGLFISSVVALLYLFQTRLIYPSSIPEHSRTIVDTPDKHNMPHYLSITLKTTDNESLDCYHIQQSVNSDPKVITLYFHANAGNMGHRLPIARQIQMYLGCDVFMVSYRGYGKSTGSANESGMKIDAKCALNHLKLKYKNSKIIVYGQSIGGAVALYLAGQSSTMIDALIVENTFLSIKVMPLLKNMTFLCTEKWESDQSVLQITKMPVLFLSGCSDELIPQIHMKTLFELCASKRSDAVVQRGMTGKHGLYWKEFPKGKHNDTCGQEGYMRAIQKFYHAHF